MTLEEALHIAREHDACDDDLHEVERCETWEKVLNHKDALYWVRWFADCLPGPLAYAREAYHEAVRKARKELTESYREVNALDRRGELLDHQLDGMMQRASEKFEATRKAASEALLVEIKKYLEIEDTVTLADGKTYGVKYYRTEPSV